MLVACVFSLFSVHSRLLCDAGEIFTDAAHAKNGSFFFSGHALHFSYAGCYTFATVQTVNKYQYQVYNFSVSLVPRSLLSLSLYLSLSLFLFHSPLTLSFCASSQELWLLHCSFISFNHIHIQPSRARVYVVHGGQRVDVARDPFIWHASPLVFSPFCSGHNLQ